MEFARGFLCLYPVIFLGWHDVGQYAQGWHDVVKISDKVVWNTVFLLFFSSFFPYVTKIVAQNFDNKVAQVFYGLIILLVTFFNTLMYRSLAEIPENTAMEAFLEGRKSWFYYDVALKIIGLILSLNIYPPAVMYSILLIMLIFMVPMIARHYR